MQNRRGFLKQAGVIGAGLMLGDNLAMARGAAAVIRSYQPVRVRGRVHLDGKGVSGVAVSDGLSVVDTDGDGSFALISDRRREFVFITLPAGYEIPVGPMGTARFYQPLRANAQGEMSAEFRLSRSRLDDMKHAFFAVGDPQVQSRHDVELMLKRSAPDLAASARNLSDRPVFGVTCGDIVYDRPDFYGEYEETVKRTGVPFFQAPGNHDVDKSVWTDAASLKTYGAAFGPANYSFDRGEVHYVVLDDVFWHGGYIGYLGQTQLDWLAADLARVQPGRTVVLFMHIPVYCGVHLRKGEDKPDKAHVIVNREALYRLLEPYRVTAVCGHMHFSEYLRDGGIDIHICGALCGAWWSDDICYDGTPNGYTLYEVDGSTLSWRYKAVGRPLSHQMRLYRPGADPAAPGAVIANIWAATGDWRVRWFEDGQPRGLMERRTGLDPLAVDLYLGPDKPLPHDWVEPELTDHLFHAVPQPGTRVLTVEATDPEGRVYQEDLVL
jgi:C terminal of Calcineurin-like phosphoesterase/N terminal of Calcineurin-like phosphoesterase/Calcineurin-like phosphoesterase